jgi:5-methylcytosine-specific restriction enzyme A
VTALPPRAAPGGHVNSTKLPKGQNGRALCRRCSTEVPVGRRSFCSQPCIDEWQIRTNPGFAARKVLARDRGCCALCGLDCLALRAELEALQADEASRRYATKHVPASYAARRPVSFPRFHARCDELDLPRHLRSLDRRLWEMDHTLPVVEGGGSCGLEGLRSLCYRCHRAETAKLARRRAERRKAGR